MVTEKEERGCIIQKQIFTLIKFTQIKQQAEQIVNSRRKMKEKGGKEKANCK